jgi:hypothetical protein
VFFHVSLLIRLVVLDLDELALDVVTPGQELPVLCRQVNVSAPSRPARP